MKKLKVFLKCILLMPLVIGGIILIWSVIPMIYNPMRRPASMIRNHILRHTPIGMCIEDVIEVIENNERWGAPTVNRRSGFRHPRRIVPEGPGGALTAATIGEQSIQTRPEAYNVILYHIRVTRIFWGFDENGQLIEVFVSSSFSPRPA